MQHEDISRNVGFLLHDVSRLLRQTFDRRARDLGLTRAQWRVLAHLGPREGINQAALAEILEVESITLGRHIDRLEEAGWVERRRDPADRRAWQLYLSDQALPTMARMRTIASDARELAMTDLGEDQRDALIATLIRMKENLIAAAGNGNAMARGQARTDVVESGAEAKTEPVAVQAVAAD